MLAQELAALRLGLDDLDVILGLFLLQCMRDMEADRPAANNHNPSRLAVGDPEQVEVGLDLAIFANEQEVIVRFDDGVTVRDDGVLTASNRGNNCRRGAVKASAKTSAVPVIVRFFVFSSSSVIRRRWGSDWV